MAHPTADKNFRLTRDVLPSRHAATLTIHPAAKPFTGRQRIDLQLGQACKEVVLHANELEIGKCLLGVNGKNYHPAKVRLEPVSETAILEFAEELPAGEAWLEMEWSGKFCAGLRGLYSAGSAAVTQFEAADARRVFPCFDEPAFKATWALPWWARSASAVLSNGGQLDRTIQGNGGRCSLPETPPLSSYLIAVVMGKLEGCPTPGRSARIAVRTWAMPEKAHLAAFGQDVAGERPAPAWRTTSALPTPSASSIRWASPTSKPARWRTPASSPSARWRCCWIPRRRPARAEARGRGDHPRTGAPVVRQLVTMQWWDDLWLNEAFATWMSYKIVDQWKPDGACGSTSRTARPPRCALDALREHPPHPLRGEERRAGERELRRHHLREGWGDAPDDRGLPRREKFRDGIRAYMRRHGQANAVADDLWAALAEVSSSRWWSWPTPGSGSAATRWFR